MSGAEGPTALPGRPVQPEHVELPIPGMRSNALPVSVRRKRRRRWEAQVTFALDAAAILLGFYLAYLVRYVLRISFGRETSFAEVERFGSLAMVLLVGTLLLLWLRGSYTQPRTVTWLGQLGTLGSSVTTAVGIAIIYTFFTSPSTWFSRLIYFYAWVLMFMMLALGRFLVGRWRRYQWHHGSDLERVVVVGGSGLGREVMVNLADSPRTGFALIGYVAGPKHVEESPPRFTSRVVAPLLGSVEQLPQVVARHQIDHVVVALPDGQFGALPKIELMCRQLGIEFQLVPDFSELSFDRVTIQELRGMPLIGLRENQIKGFNFLLKRVLDVTLTLLGMPIWGSISIFIALLVKFTSPGPVLLRQTRIGRNGRPFEFLKFRSMVANAEELKAQLMAQNEADGPLFKLKNDPRITPVGRVLRKTSLDEFPNFWNVLRGEMSLVGPRPAIPEEVLQYKPEHHLRLEVMPGITGLWQVTGRSDSSFDEYVRLDVYYAEHWSVWLDIRILLATIPAWLWGRGAY